MTLSRTVRDGALDTVPGDHDAPVLPADRDVVPVDDAGDADARLVAKALDGGQVAELLARPSRDGLCDRMLGGGLDGAGEPQHVRARRTVLERDLGQLHLPFGDGAGLVEHDRVHAPRLLEDLRVP